MNVRPIPERAAPGRPPPAWGPSNHQWGRPEGIRHDRRLRILFLASYFPKPTNPWMGTWALSQAKALARQPLQLRTVSFTSWVPDLPALSPGARAYARCPVAHEFDGLRVVYPRWAFYQVNPFAKWARRDPRVQLEIAWLSVRARLLRCAAEWRPDVLFAHHALVNGYMAERLKECTGIPYIVTDHDFDEIRDCARFAGRWQAYARVARSAHTMVSVSSRMERDVRAIFPGTATRTIWNGADPIDPSVLARARPAELVGRAVVFNCGNFALRKDVPRLIAAFATVAAQRRHAVLRIAGDGVERPAVERAVRESCVSGQIRLLGRLPQNQVFQEMAWSDLVALTGYDEPFATVFLEAMAAGRPIIYCSDGGITDVVADGVDGIAVPPRDRAAIVRALFVLLDDANMRERMGRHASQVHRRRLTWDANAEAMHEVFERASREA